MATCIILLTIIIVAVGQVSYALIDSGLFRDGVCYNNDFTGLRIAPAQMYSKYPFSDILFCFHEKGHNAPLYAKHKIYATSIEENCDVDEFNSTKWHWTPGSLFPSPNAWTYDVDSCFEEKFQNKTFGLLLGKYTNEFLVQSQLVPVCDISYSDNERNVTFHYVNVAPMYKSMRLGNWKRLENDIRSLTRKSNFNLTIVTGVYGRLNFNNTKLKDVIINLGRDKYDNLLKQLPVPRLFWKVLYDEATHSGHALIMINNPTYVPSRTPEPSEPSSSPMSTNIKDYIVCPNVCDKIDWIKWNTTADVTAGYIYCCEIKDFGSVVHYIHQYIDDHDEIGLTLGKRKDSGVDIGVMSNRFTIIVLVLITKLLSDLNV